MSATTIESLVEDLASGDKQGLTRRQQRRLQRRLRRTNTRAVFFDEIVGELEDDHECCELMHGLAATSSDSFDETTPLTGDRIDDIGRLLDILMEKLVPLISAIIKLFA